MKITCPFCGKKIEIKKSGKNKCPLCEKKFEFVKKIVEDK